MLASGAWKDRPLPVNRMETHLGKNFYYQNPFVDWFNHHHEPNYNGYNYNVKDGAIIIGGGLSSIDVAKIVMLETTMEALAKRNIKGDMLELEHYGIPKGLEAHNITFEELGLKGCTLYYRRRDIDMPLKSIADDLPEDKKEKLRAVRTKILQKAQEKFLFKFEGCCRPINTLEEKKQLSGMVFQKTEITNSRVVDIPGNTFSVNAPMVISSIGSIPETIHPLSRHDELFKISNPANGKLDDFKNIFALGNAVTGRGNIKESEKHAKQVSIHVMEHFLNWQETDFEAAQSGNWENISDSTNHTRTVSQIESIIDKIKQRQIAVDYHDYQKWIKAHLPVRLENLEG